MSTIRKISIIIFVVSFALLLVTCKSSQQDTNKKKEKTQVVDNKAPDKKAPPKTPPVSSEKEKPKEQKEEGKTPPPPAVPPPQPSSPPPQGEPATAPVVPVSSEGTAGSGNPPVVVEITPEATTPPAPPPLGGSKGPTVTIITSNPDSPPGIVNPAPARPPAPPPEPQITVDYLLNNLDKADPTDYVINRCVDDKNKKDCKKNYDNYWISLNLACFQEKKGKALIEKKWNEKKCQRFTDLPNKASLTDLLATANAQKDLRTFKDFVDTTGFIPLSYPKEYKLSLAFQTLDQLTTAGRSRYQLMLHEAWDHLIFNSAIKIYDTSSVLLIKPPQKNDLITKIKLFNRLTNFNTPKQWQSIKPESISDNELSLSIPNTENTKALVLTIDKNTFEKSNTNVYSFQVIDLPVVKK